MALVYFEAVTRIRNPRVASLFSGLVCHHKPLAFFCPSAEDSLLIVPLRFSASIFLLTPPEKPCFCVSDTLVWHVAVIPLTTLKHVHMNKGLLRLTGFLFLSSVSSSLCKLV